jgi:predicted O-methyltransferase YrrM
MLLQNIVSKIELLRHYLIYLFRSRHWKGHGVHSPFAYELISKVIFDSHHYMEYDLIDDIRTKLQKSNEYINIEEIGAGSLYFINGKRKVSDIIRKSSVSPKYGRLLFRMVKFFKPTSIIEFGTSLGISSIFLAMGNDSSTLFTVEKSNERISFAASLFEKYKIKNIELIKEDFDEVLTGKTGSIPTTDFIFIDGNHTFEATIRYFEFFASRMSEGIIVFDDIKWSSGMRKAWKTIVASPESHVTIDLFYVGIVIRHRDITHNNYIVRF